MHPNLLGLVCLFSFGTFLGGMAVFARERSADIDKSLLLLLITQQQVFFAVPFLFPPLFFQNTLMGMHMTKVPWFVDIVCRRA